MDSLQADLDVLNPKFRMAFPRVIAVFHALFNAIGLSGNFLVILTIILERRLHKMSYFLLASLAVSDFLCLILVITRFVLRA